MSSSDEAFYRELREVKAKLSDLEARAKAYDEPLAAPDSIMANNFVRGPLIQANWNLRNAVVAMEQRRPCS